MAGNASVVRITPTPTSRTEIDLLRWWDVLPASTDYNINNWGWIREWTGYSNGVHVDYNIVSRLTPNTRYQCQIRVHNINGSIVYSNVASAVTLHNAPKISSVSVSCTRASSAPYSTYTANFNYSVTYDYAGYKSRKIQYGKTKNYDKTISGTKTISGLEPNTTYYYKITEEDNGMNSTTTSTVEGSFKTPVLKPNDVTLTQTGRDLTSMSFKWDGKGDTNAEITKFVLHFRKKGASSYQTLYSGLNKEITIEDLEIDTNYEVYLDAVSAAGTTTTATQTLSTLFLNPKLTEFKLTNLKPFSCTLTVTASIDPLRILSYRFSKDNEQTWTEWQTNNKYDWTDLEEETIYPMVAQVKATHDGIQNQDTYAKATMTVETPIDQARIYINTNGTEVRGKCFINKQGHWIRGEEVYIKVNGHWMKKTKPSSPSDTDIPDVLYATIIYKSTENNEEQTIKCYSEQELRNNIILINKDNTKIILKIIH